MANPGLSSRRSLVSREVQRQIGYAKLPADLETLVRAQFHKSARTCDKGCSLFGVLPLYCFESAGGGPVNLAVPASAAVEFVATAASVLDDLQDGDEVPQLGKNDQGAGVELVALLLVLSQKALASLHSNRIPANRIINAFEVVARHEVAGIAGQHESNELTSSEESVLEKAIRRSAAKSGSIGRLAAEVGAALATDDIDIIGRLGDFGWHTAIIDQAQNDVAAIWPQGERSSDLTLRRVTPPVAFATHLVERDKQSLLQEAIAGRLGETHAREVFFSSGAIHFTWVLAALHRAKATTIARELSLVTRASRLEDLLSL